MLVVVRVQCWATLASASVVQGGLMSLVHRFPGSCDESDHLAVTRVMRLTGVWSTNYETGPLAVAGVPCRPRPIAIAETQFDTYAVEHSAVKSQRPVEIDIAEKTWEIIMPPSGPASGLVTPNFFSGSSASFSVWYTHRCVQRGTSIGAVRRPHELTA